MVLTSTLVDAQEIPTANGYGRVMFGEHPVPGAVVTASRVGRRVETTTNSEGVYHFIGVDAGVWTLEVRMTGFAPVRRRLRLTPDAEPATWRLTLLSAASAAAAAPVVVVVRAVPGVGRAADALDDRADAPEDVLLVTGSINNASTSPFGQLGAFGNNRPSGRPEYRGAIRIRGGNAAWDARPYAIAGPRMPKPAYADVDVGATFGGPWRIPGVGAPGDIYINVEHTTNHRARSQSALLPTLRERAGDFSQTRDVGSGGVTLRDPATGQPFEAARIPQSRVSPQAVVLLGYYPAPSFNSGEGYNHQAPIVSGERRQRVETRYQTFTLRNQVSGALSYQEGKTDSLTLFGFEDKEATSALDASVGWRHTAPRRLWLQGTYRFARGKTAVTPHFAHTVDVLSEAGIGGSNPDPLQWGPPTLLFTNGLAALTSAPGARRRDRTHTWSAEVGLFSRNRHEFRFGGGVGLRALDQDAPSNPRGEFLFTGAATGSPFADFLLGLPQAVTVGFGHAGRHLHAPSAHAFVTDDWRLRPRMTLTLGVRWEYEAPMTERFDRLANLDIAPGFTAASPVVAGSPVGEHTGRRYPRALLRSDWLGVQPRLGLAWRPVAGSSLVVRASYGLYRNAGAYESLATLLAQQPPLATTLSLERGPSRPLTLADGLVAVPGGFRTTFAVDPEFRAGIAQTWQVSMGYDLPAAMTVVASYTGTAGSRLLRQSLPNTAPLDTPEPCPGCPVGFVYATSDGSSVRHAGQVALRRRLRNGLTARVEYTLARAVDDGVSFGGASLAGAFIAQDWRNLDAEHGPSTFDQRHRVVFEMEYTTGVGLGGGALWGGLASRLLGGWTFSAQVTVGSGLPFTPLYLAAVPGTGFSGVLRADLTGTPPGDVPRGFFLNPAAYALPPAGQWGAAGRHSVNGPAQFDFDAGIGRSFAWGERTFDWRLEATNVLNRVTYAAVDPVIGSPQFGLPTLARPMRALRTSLRVGF